MGTISYEYRAANAEVSHEYLYPVVSRLLKDVPAGAIVVDAGCGNGSFLSLFRHRNWQLAGFDASPTGIEIARNTYPEIDFYLADGQTISSELLKFTGQTDLVIATEVIEHLY